MSMLGTLSEFPLPEVLLSIGNRSGRLRLYDVPSSGVMEIHLRRGYAHNLCRGGSSLMEPSQIVAELCDVVESGRGMFEFRAQEVDAQEGDESLPIDRLVMMLIVRVDEKLADRQTLLGADLIYILEVPTPEIWIDPDLEKFYQKCYHDLVHGARSENLAKSLGLENDHVRLNLDYLRQLGFVRLIYNPGVATADEMMPSAEVSDQTGKLQLVKEASELIRRTGKLMKLWRAPGPRTTALSSL